MIFYSGDLIIFNDRVRLALSDGARGVIRMARMHGSWTWRGPIGNPVVALDTAGANVRLHRRWTEQTAQIAWEFNQWFTRWPRVQTVSAHSWATLCSLGVSVIQCDCREEKSA